MQNEMTTSIRTFLLINLLLSITMITSLAIIGNLFVEHKDLRQHLDSQLTLIGMTIQALVSSDIHTRNLKQIQSKIDRVPGLMEQFNYQSKPASLLDPIYEMIQFQIYDKKGRLLLHSSAAPMIMIARKIGLTDTWVNEKPWRAFSTVDQETGLRVVVGERYNFREEIESRITQDSIFIMLITYPFFGLLIWIIVGRGLDTLKRIAKELRQRAPSYLESVDLESIPSEIQPLIDELNRLFKRLKEAFEREQRFAADAAHELRTPLAALKAHAQVALNANNGNEQRDALNKVVEGVNRSTHIVEQLLTLSRMVPQSVIQDFELVDLTKQARETIAQVVPSAIKKNTEIELKPSDKPAIIKGNSTAINILIRNLVYNAICYTPEGSSIQVITEHKDDKVILKVIDNGPGIPEELRTRVFERFVRVLGSKAPGSGLGLGIVQQLADLHDARVYLDTPESGQGLEVTAIFHAA